MSLYTHQANAVDFIVSKNFKGALFMDAGTGKTYTSIKIYEKLKQHVNARLLVICPISLIEAAWISDIKKFTKLTYCNARKEKYVDQDVLIINYEWLRNPEKYLRLIELTKSTRFMCVLDESSKIKNPKSMITKKILSMKDNFLYRLVMSSTPAPNCATEYWSQMNFVDNVFHSNFYVFRNKYFHYARGDQRLDKSLFFNKGMAQEYFRRGFQLSITTKSLTNLLETISLHAYRANKNECLDLPDKVDEIRHVEMSSEQRRLYKSMKSNYIAQINRENIVAQVALSKIMKLRQITSGFAISEKGQAVGLGTNPKLTELMSLLSELGHYKVIIWCNFHREIEDVSRMLGNRSCSLYGKTKDKQASIEEFNGNKQFLVAHPKSAAHGLTFIKCSYQVFYSLDYSWENYEQAKDRIHRIGQVNKCTYFHLIAKDTIDETIYKVLQRKGTQTELLDEICVKNS